MHLPRSRHILTVEPDKEMMFEASIRFMEECVGSGFAQKSEKCQRDVYHRSQRTFGGNHIGGPMPCQEGWLRQ